MAAGEGLLAAVRHGNAEADIRAAQRHAAAATCLHAAQHHAAFDIPL